MTDKRSLRAIALLAVTLLLGGCNLVVSETPVFSTVDATGAPPLRPGVWAAPQPDCDFKPSEPLDRWPKCAGGAAITPDAILAATDDPSSLSAAGQAPPADAKPPMRVPYVLAAGDPRVMQIHFVLPIDPAIKAAFFYFIALKPTAHDADGRITAAEAWLIQCGPPPPPSVDSSGKPNQGGLTDHPLPGMKVEKGECTPSGKAAVVGAALPSRAWADNQVGMLRWVRDGLK
jgi:hypothetical protein